MGYWRDEVHGTDYEWTEPTLDVETTDNPVTHTLLGPDGEPLVVWRARPACGFR